VRQEGKLWLKALDTASGFEAETYEAVCALFGGEEYVNDVGCDVYDSSLEVYTSEKIISAWRCSEKLRDSLIALGFGRFWINFTDQTEQYGCPEKLTERYKRNREKPHPERRAALEAVVNDVWIAQYGGERVLGVAALCKRVRLLQNDLNCWKSNASGLNTAYVELDARNRRLIEDLDRVTRGTWSKELARLSAENLELRAKVLNQPQVMLVHPSDDTAEQLRSTGSMLHGGSDCPSYTMRSGEVGKISHDISFAPDAFWQPMETAPWDEIVMLTGDSGYIAPKDRFIINGYRVRDWHQGAWNDVTGTPLMDAGWKPDGWAPVP
jgi:hypothetical protein